MALLACEGPGSVPPPQAPGEPRLEATLHKVQLSAEQAARWEQRGTPHQLIADYGAFQLVQVDDAALATLPASEDVERKDESNQLLLNAGVIDTASAHGQSLRGMKSRAAGKGLHLVQFAGPILPEWYRALEATGVQIVTYIPHNAYLVYGTADALDRLAAHVREARAIQWDGGYLNDYKLHPSVLKASTPTYTVQLVRDERENATTLELIRQLQSREGRIREVPGYVNVAASLTLPQLYDIASRPDVVSIQPYFTPRKVDERQDMILAGQITGNGPSGPGYLAWLASKGFTQAQFNGSGFGVDVSDSGLDNGTQLPNHFGLYTAGDVTATGRVAYNRLEGTANSGSTLQGCDGHGTLNAHIIAGYSSLTGEPFTDGTGFTHGLGVAPFVRVGSSVVFDPEDFTHPDYEDLQSRAYRDGMRISSNSWGAEDNGYGADAQAYDALVRDAQPTGSAVPVAGNQEMVILFAAGNFGSYANTVGAPATAKNVITVGASENARAFGAADLCDTPDSEANSLHDIASFSSRGPTSDGRKKPDLMAPGTHVAGGVAQEAGQRAHPPASATGKALGCFTAEGVCGGPQNEYYPVGQQWYTASSGTSHSAPAVAGGAALVRQYFINQGLPPPSPAMTKAYLMNSARYMTGTGANDNLFSNNQGMGLMDLGFAFDGTLRVLSDQESSQLFTASGQRRAFAGAVQDASRPFRVTLAWTDAPGSTTGSAWKNNLDLAVTVGGATYKGNVFNKGASVTGGGADEKNNVESVFLPAGTSGPFTVTVTATNINSDGVPGNGSVLDQDFALVVYNNCSTPGALPTGVTATATGANRIEVGWTPNGPASRYTVSRATSPGGPYTFLSEVTAPPYADTQVSGGTTYYYVVRGVACTESAPSAEASATAMGTCTYLPTFAGLTSVTNAGAATCGTSLDWGAAAPGCGGAVSYSIYRSTAQGFTPSAINRIATGVTGTQFADTLNLTSGTVYHYVVRATETSATGTVEETNTVMKSSVTTGAITPGVRYFDDFDAHRPTNASAYWTSASTTGSTQTLNIVDGCHYQSATKAYRFGSTSTACGTTYPAGTQVNLVLGGTGSVAGINGFSIPANAVNPELTFNVWYDLDTNYDGVSLAYNTTSAFTPWIDVPDAPSTTAPYISEGGYDGVLSSNLSRRVWTGSNKGAHGALKSVTLNLKALAGKKVWFAFRAYSDSIYNAEGFYVDNVRLTADSAATCTTSVPPPGPAVSYQLSALPVYFSAGTPVTFTVTALDAVGQTATGYTGSASFTSTDAQAVLPSPVAFTAGVARNVPITFKTVGTQSVTATGVEEPSLKHSASATVTAGPASRLVFLTQPPPGATAGSAFSGSIRVGLVDAFGNAVSSGLHGVTMALGNNPGGSTLSGTTTATTSSGVATFSFLSLNKTGNGYTLVASSPGLTSVTSTGISISPAGASKLAFLTPPTGGTAGQALSPALQVEVLDPFDNRVPSTFSVTLEVNTHPAGGTLSGTKTVSAVNGVATFSNLSLDKAGTGYKLTATSGSRTQAVSPAFNIAAGAASRVRFTQQPASATVGAPLSPAVQVTLQDAFGNTAAQSALPITVALGNGQGGALLGGTTTVNAVAGVASFSTLSVNRPGTGYVLTASASGLTPDTSAAFAITAGAPAQLAITASPSAPVAAGVAFPARVEVRDSNGHVVTNASVQVTLTLDSAPGATLGGTTTVTTVNGVASFTGLSVDKAGTGYSLLASAPGLPSVLSGAFGVTPGPAVKLGFLTQPSATAAGADMVPDVRVAFQDAHGNTVTASPPPIALALETSVPGAVVGYTGPATANGVVTFNHLTVNKKGTGYRLRASSGAFATLSEPFEVTAGTAARLVFLTPPANTQAGEVLAPVEVEFQDAEGNRDTHASGSVKLRLGGPSGGTLEGTFIVSALQGVATFSSLSIRQAAQGYTLIAQSGALPEATSAAFHITPGPAKALAFRVQPSTGVAGAVFTPAVKAAITDAYGNTVPDAAAQVTLALETNPSGGMLLGTATVAAVQGVATFTDLSIPRAGTGYTLTAASGSLTGASSTAFDILPGARSRLAFKLQPQSTVAGNPLGTVSVEFQDALGNRVASSLPIHLKVQDRPGVTLMGTPTVNANDGIATFDTLSIRQAGEGYRLTAQADGTAEASSTAFTLVPGPAAALVFTVQPGAARVGALLEPAIRVSFQDAFGNLATSAWEAVTLTLGTNPGGGTLSGSRTVSPVQGMATFANLSIDRAGVGYALKANSGTLPAVESQPFTVSEQPAARLVFRPLPDAGRFTAGVPFSVQVEVQDAQGRALASDGLGVTLSLGENPGHGTLEGPVTATTVHGVATFGNLSLRKAAAAYTLLASATGVQGAASTPFTVVAGPAARLTLELPSSVSAGQGVEIASTAVDAYGNLARTYGGTVQASSSDAQAVLPAVTAFVQGALPSGATVTFRGKGLVSITLTDTGNPLLTVTAQTTVTPFAQPTVAVTEPRGGTTVSGQVKLTAEGTVAAGTTLAQLSLLVDGQQAATGTGAVLTATWDSDAAAPGEHIITAVITDGAGNMAVSAPVSVTVKGSGSGGGCGATLGPDASLWLGALVLARYTLGRRRRAQAA
ncbi:Immune inhibitor A peptidase M6 [Stigmatella aurantiaca]|uniref:Immune inhibitor A peptidase M6 n=1 Tax=Stigmatella aurantiaca TaxID=41 RepID=A0A1H7HSH2_STIAU|nr:S8 family serine peptidase [Stigmatella aurantiaca]SEK53333.1 Immune inhibitor A peptidase M6 [Stigmatella aurantiaca]